MGYCIKKTTWKSGPGWKLQYITYDKKSAAKPKDGKPPAKQPRKVKDIPKTDWPEHGFNLKMSIEEARAKVDSLNAQAEVKRWGETKAKIRARIQKDDTVECAFLPDHFVNEFEQKILFEKMARGSEDTRFKSKIDSHWRATKKIIREVALDPSEWEENDFKFYNLFVKKQMSPSYVQKILRILNHWGYFMARKTSKPFMPIATPRGSEAQRIADAFYDKTPSGEGNESDPLTPQMLETARSNLLDDNYNWLFISVWFGLRPHEIEGLRDPKNWKVSINKKGRKLLHVYQPKLTTVPKPKRWKVIPLVCPEQERAVAMIEKGQFRKPIYKVVHRWFGEGVTLYGGRKNFVDMMLEKGHTLDKISMWMGHRNIDRTWRDYKDRLKTEWEDVG